MDGAPVAKVALRGQYPSMSVSGGVWVPGGVWVKPTTFVFFSGELSAVKVV